MMQRASMAALILLICLLVLPTKAHGQDRPRFGIGAQLGAPFGSAAPVPVGLTARLAITRNHAIDLGFGAPVATLGLSVWSDYHLSTDLGGITKALRFLELYAGLGAHLGVPGPSYYARKYNAYVGFQYIFSSNGDVAFAVRAPVGLRVLFFERHFELFAESETTFLLSPSRELLGGAAFGSRYYF